MTESIKPRILIADDDELVLCMLQATLEDHYSITTASDGDAALASLADTSFDLVLLDVAMPGRNGYEVCQVLRSEPRTAEIPVLFHSAHTHLEERLQGYAAGGDDYLAKPFDPAELLAKLTRLAAQRHQSQCKEQEFVGQLDEMMNAALSSADMAGDAGVVLDFQRQLVHCADLTAVSRCVLDAMARYGLEGCVRLRSTLGTVSMNARTDVATALECSILDSVERRASGPSIQAYGPHTSFRYDSVLLFVRDLQMDRPESMDRQVSERMGRHIDNVALLAEGALARVRALEAAGARRELVDTQQLVTVTREALCAIAVRSHQQRLMMQSIFQSLSEQLEQSFLSLGLTAAQEEMLSDMVQRCCAEAEGVVGDAQEVEGHLNHLIQRLQPHV